MSFMPWTDVLAMGIETIDNQHRWLVDATIACMARLPSRARIGPCWVKSSKGHFVLEEELFQRFGYPKCLAAG